MSSAGGRRVVVGADVHVQVRAPDGRGTTVVLADRDGVLRVDVGDPAVVLASLPREPLRGGTLRRLRGLLVDVDGHLGPVGERPVWDQPVDVALAGHVVVRRRDGRWRPTARLLVPAAAGTVVLVTTAAFVVAGALAGALAVVRRLRRRRGPAPARSAATG